ncbi:MAG: hypothetical protein R3E53_04430 [Myxococcota bacterium]
MSRFIMRKNSLSVPAVPVAKMSSTRESLDRVFARTTVSSSSKRVITQARWKAVFSVLKIGAAVRSWWRSG